MMKINPDIIVQKVAFYYGQELCDLQHTSKCRNRDLVKTRQLTMFFLKEMTGMTILRIGQIYSKDHATVVHSCKQVRNLYDTDKLYRTEVDELRAIMLKYKPHKERMSLQYDLMSFFGKQILPQAVL